MHKTMTTVNVPSNQPPAMQKKFIDADTYDSFLNLLLTQPEGSSTPESVLRWNSCLREVRQRFEYLFGRG